MKRYRVYLNELSSYKVEVDANDEQEAGEAAEEAFVQSDKINEFPCSINSREVGSVEEIGEAISEFDFLMGVNVRAYGHVTVEAASLEAAIAKLTVYYVAENIRPDEVTWDNVSDLSIISASRGDEVLDTECDLPDPGRELVSSALAFVDEMARMTTPEDEFESRKGQDGKVNNDGLVYEDVDEMIADMDDDRLCGEYEAFMSMVHKARAIVGNRQSDGGADG